MIRVVAIAHVMFNVTDLERSLKLYRDLLGFKVSGEYEGGVIWLNMGQYCEGQTLAFHDIGLYKVPNPAPENARNVVGLNHAAFRLGTPEEVDKAAELLKANGANRVFVCATHPVFSDPAVERLCSIDIEEIVVTDTIPLPPRKLLSNTTVLSVAPLLAEVIRRAHEGRSVGELFNE